MQRVLLMTQAQSEMLRDLELDVQRTTKIRDTFLYAIIAGVTSHAKLLGADVSAKTITIEVPDISIPQLVASEAEQDKPKE